MEELNKLQEKYDELYEKFRQEKLELEKKYEGGCGPHNHPAQPLLLWGRGRGGALAGCCRWRWCWCRCWRQLLAVGGLT